MYQHPGVYIEHVPSGVLAIEAASTSVAAFIGTVGRGKLHEPVFVTSSQLYATNFGPLGDTGTGIRDFGANPDQVGFAGNAFFQNGRRQTYHVPTTPVAATPLRLTVGGTGVIVNFDGTANTLEKLAAAIQAQVRAAGAAPALAGFLCQVTRNRELLLIAGGNAGSAVLATGG